MKDNSNVKRYWENKILIWEFLRYSNYLIFYPASWTLRSRMYSCLSFLKTIDLKERKVVELGCGSGILAEHLKNKIKNYIGYDIASNAILLAKRKFENNLHFQFYSEDITNFHFPKHDLTIFLGLTDWLDDKELEFLFKNLNSDEVIFSYTSPQSQNNFIYKFYRRLHDFIFAPKSYSAKSYSEEFILNLLIKNGFKILKKQSSSYFNPGNLIWAQRK